MGRPKLPEGCQKVEITVTLSKNTMAALGMLSQYLGKSRSAVVEDALTAMNRKHGFKAGP